MPRRPSFEPKQDPSKLGTASEWYVVTPASMTGDGQLKRTYFPTEKEAQREAGKIKNRYHKGTRNAVVSPLLAQDATKAAAILAEFGVSLTEAANAYASRVRVTGSTETFRERYDKFVALNEMEWSARYCRDMERLPDKLPDEFMAKKVAEIGEADIRAASGHSSTGETAIETRSRHIRAAISCKPKKAKTKKPPLFTPKQVEALLKACKTPAETHSIALMLFAGVRPDAEDGELVKLVWEDVSAHHVAIRREVAKTGTSRKIIIRPRLRQLLKGHPKSGKIVPAQWRKTVQRIRKDAGIDGTKYQDAARHTFASNHLMAYGEDKTKEAMGHTANSRTLFIHYREAVTQTAAKAYFAKK